MAQLDNPLEALTDALGVFPAEAVACGIVVSNWRDAMEPLHRTLTDPEMAYINIATTRAVVPACTPTDVDWGAVRATLLDPEREILPGRTARQVAGKRWRGLRSEIQDRLLEAERLPAAVHAGWAFMVCPKWWGMPAYSDQVDELVASGRVTLWPGTASDLQEALKNDPLAVPLEVWEQIVGGNGFDWMDR